MKAQATAIERVCKLCGTQFRSASNLYCSKKCEAEVKRSLKEAGYLRATPSFSYRMADKPGPRHCAEGSGGWDNAVRAVEDG